MPILPVLVNFIVHFGSIINVRNVLAVPMFDKNLRMSFISVRYIYINNYKMF